MFMRPKSMVGLDIGASSVKAVELTQQGRDTVVTGFGRVEIPPDDAGAKIQAIQDLLREGGFKSKRVVTGVSGKSVIIRYLNMVKMSDDELRNAIVFEAEKYIPFPAAECVMDCQRLEVPGETDSNNMPVLLVAVRRTLVEDHLSLLQAAGVTPEIVDVDAFALGNAHALCAAAAEAAGRTEAFVDLGAATANINIVRGSTSLFTREVGIGGQDFTDAITKRLAIDYDQAESLKRDPGDGEEVIREASFPIIDDLGSEIQLSFDYFENHYEKEIETIQLSGGGALLDCVRDSVEKIFERPTEVFNPFDSLKISSDIDLDLLNAHASQLVIAVGLAARIRRN